MCLVGRFKRAGSSKTHPSCKAARSSLGRLDKAVDRTHIDDIEAPYAGKADKSPCYGPSL